MLVSGDELACKIKPIKANVCGVMDLLPSKHLLVLKMSSKTSSTRLQRNNFTSSKTS